MIVNQQAIIVSHGNGKTNHHLKTGSLYIRESGQ
jgi:hypothetical protein